MAIPFSTWALVAGVAASAAVLLGRGAFNPEMPSTVVWLGVWATLFATQAASWTLSRKSIG